MANGEITSLSIPVISNADEVAREFSRLGSAARRLRDASGALAGGMEEAANAADDMGTEIKEAGEQSEKVRPKVRGLGDDAKKTGDNAQKGSAGIKVFWNAMKRLGNISFKGIKGALFDLPRYFGGKFLDNVKQAVGGIGQFFNSIKRIALYRAIRTALKLITQGFSEGMQNLYAWSSAVNGTFAASMDRLASASLYLKNSMAAMVSPLVEAIAPAVDFVIDKFVDLFNVINQVFALLAGKVSYTAANKVSAQWKAASNSASGSAKKAADEIKRTLLGFDEINKLNDNNKNSGSGGGGGGGSSGSGALGFEERPISDWIQNMFDSGNFSALGTLVAEKINTALNNISWETIRAKSFKFVDSITSLLNGFIKEIDGTLLGKSLAEAINTAVASINRFWDKTNWAEAGKKLHDAIVAFFADIDVVGAANALTAKFKSIVTLIGNALPQSPGEWAVIGKKISGFISTAISNISTSGIGDVIGNLISGGLTTITILANDSTLTKIANGIKTNIENACKKITPQQVSQFVNAVLRDVMSAIGVLFSIDLQFGDITISPVAVAAFGVAASALLKNAFSSIFGGNVTPAGLGKSLAFTAGVALAIQAFVDLIDIVNDIRTGSVDWSKVGGFLRSAALSTGMFMLGSGNYAAGIVALGIGLTIEPLVNNIAEIVNDLKSDGGISWDRIAGIVKILAVNAGIFLLTKGHYAAGVVALGVGLVIEPMVNKIVDIVNDVKENGLTADTLWDIIGLVAAPIGLALVSKGIGVFKASMGISLGLSSVTMEAASAGLSGFANAAGLKMAFVGVLEKLFSSTLGATFGSCALVGGAIVLTTLIAVKIIPEEFDFEYSQQTQANNPTDPTSMYSDPELGGNKYGTSNPSQLKYLPGFEGDPTMVVGVDYVANGNTKYKNGTLGNYLVDTMKNTNSTASTKVKSIAGTLMKVVGGKLTPVTTNTNTTNTVKGAAGSGMKSVSGKYTPVVSNTTTTNTVKAAAGAGVKASGKSYVVSMANTKTSNEVYAVAGVGMVKLSGTNSYSIKAVDTKTKDTVSGASGTGMAYDKSAGKFYAKVTNTTSTDTVKGAAGAGMTANKNGTKFTPKVNDTSSTVSVKKGWTGKVLDKLGLSNLSTTIKVGLKVDKKRSKAVITGDTGSIYTVSTRGEKAKGGILSNGVWSNIPQYAGGTANAHGSLFLAGEAGPEIVGHVGGRTEVLNKSQIASAMYSAVQAAMAPAAANFAAAASNMSAASVGVDLETLAEMVRQGVEQAMSRTNDLDRQRNEYLRQINEKDSTVEVSTSSINRAQTRMNRRAGTTIVAVGT
jgi:hypothetical protein